ncbi:hypothetical protein WMY93_023164 [Mugilogobius chulae]|uniref:PH domain-containing protein n=1 Tax=Mugilogobius chulae TaxID=88201 RepID=A0AAW0N529_9GOBI
MAMTRDELLKPIWHAFTALDLDRSGKVSKSQLKVLSHNLCTVLKVPHDPVALEEHFKDDDEGPVSNQGYMPYLSKYILEKVKGDFNKVDFNHMCWTLCCKKNLEKCKLQISEDDAFRLWCIFNFLSEDTYPLVIVSEEMEYLLRKLCEAMGGSWVEQGLDQTWTRSGSQLSVWDLLSLMGAGLFKNIHRHTLSMGIGEVYQELILDVLKQGFLQKKGHKRKNWTERWFVLRPDSVSYFTGEDQKDKKGDIILDGNCFVESLPDKDGKKCLFLVKSSSKASRSAPPTRRRNKNGSKPFRWLCPSFGSRDVLLTVSLSDSLFSSLSSFSSLMVVSLLSLLTLSLLFSLFSPALQMVVSLLRQQRCSPHKEARQKRREQRMRLQAEQMELEQRMSELQTANELKQRELEDMRKALENPQRTQQKKTQTTPDAERTTDRFTRDLEREKMVREEMEQQMAQKSSELETYLQRVKELENMYQQLEGALEEERRARQDEETVRKLQARRGRCLRPRGRNQELQKEREAKERALRDAMTQLEELETERRGALEPVPDGDEEAGKRHKQHEKLETQSGRTRRNAAPHTTGALETCKDKETSEGDK